MLENVSGINSSTVLWYASRATGVVALLLLTAVLLLGLLVTRLIESYGRPASLRPAEPDGWDDGTQTINSRATDPGWSTPRRSPPSPPGSRWRGGSGSW